LFRTLSLSSHAITNIEIIRAFLDVVFNVRQMTDAAWDVAVERS
jgi:RNA 3'-terminal phosphate cyclase